MLPHLSFAHELWEQHLSHSLHPTVIDATAGNGKDLLVLAHLVEKNRGFLHAFDIQQKALISAKKYLTAHLDETMVNKIQFYHSCHSQLELVSEKADLIVYNLGYLPGSDKKIITTEKSTVISVKKALDKIKPKGLISLICYIGHPRGAEEFRAVKEILQPLDPRDWEVSQHEWVNRPNSPILFCCRKQSSFG